MRQFTLDTFSHTAYDRQYMKTYDLASLTKEIRDSGLYFFRIDTLQNVLKVPNHRSLYNVLSQLIRAGILDKAERNIYIRSDYQGSEFALANFLYQPSYISFESALSFYGVLSQFPTEVTSATLKLPRTKICEDRQFSYFRIKKDLFWGYVKQENYLIAEAEKALLDQMYLATKGSRSLSFDEYDFSCFNKKTIYKYAHMFPQTRQFLSRMKQLQEYL